jgi:WD40 repeat protein
LLRIEVPGLECFCIFFSVDGKSILSGWNDGKIRAFLPQSGKLLFAINASPPARSQPVDIVGRNYYEFKHLNSMNVSICYTNDSNVCTEQINVIDNNTEFIFEISTEQYMSLNDLYKSILSGYKIIPNKTEHENSPITISLIGRGIYYGFAISDNKKFVLPDYTVVHNCNTKYCKTCNKEIK